jgi:hypothetical protein
MLTLKNLAEITPFQMHKALFVGFSILFLSSCSSEAQTKKNEECSAPSLVSRSVWKAKPAKVHLMKKQVPVSIVIHHSGSKRNTRSSVEKKLQNLQKFSQKKGRVGLKVKPAWGDVPYHFYINNDGKIGKARDVMYAGDTNTGYNTKNKIQIVVEGNFVLEKPTKGQKISLKKLLCWLRKKYKISKNEVYGHNEKASTACPGKNLTSILPELLK